MQEAVHAPTNGTSTTGLSERNNIRDTFSELLSSRMIGGVFTLILLAVGGWWVYIRKKTTGTI
jgi:hypothetical protein